MKFVRVYFPPLIFIFLFGCSTQTEYLPNSIDGLSLSNKLVDGEAERFVNRLHFNTVAAERNEIGFYSASKGKAIIYVSYYETGSDAAENLKLMTEKISPHNSVFSGGENFELNGLRIFRYYGMGQTHFVLLHNKVLLWISAEMNWAEKFLSAYVEFIEQ